MRTEPELLNIRLERLAHVLDVIMPNCANLVRDALELLKERPELVRCKYCVHWDKGHTEECDNSDSVCFHNGWCKPDWYCADGERRDDDA